MEISAEMKRGMIQNYVTSIDFKNDYSVKRIKEDLKNILHETPGVEIKYKKDRIITEDRNGNKSTKVDEKVKSIIIAFVDGEDNNGHPMVHKVEFFV